MSDEQERAVSERLKRLVEIAIDCAYGGEPTDRGASNEARGIAFVLRLIGREDILQSASQQAVASAGSAVHVASDFFRWL